VSDFSGLTYEAIADGVQHEPSRCGPTASRARLTPVFPFAVGSALVATQAHPVHILIGSLAWVVKTDGNTDFAPQLRSAIAAIDPGQRVRRVRTMNEIVALMPAISRFNATLFGILRVWRCYSRRSGCTVCCPSW
jgi:hypothetical protein